MGSASNGLPDLPPEWGKVQIPDDAAELDPEAEIIRRELRHEAKLARRKRSRARWRRRLHLPEHIDDPQQPSILLPLLIVGIALLITLISLIIVALPSLTTPGPGQINPGPSVVTTS